MSKYLNTRNIARIAVLSALGAVLMLIDFPIFVAPSFYKLDLGDLPCLIGSFAMGPVPALFIQILKIFLKLIMKPTSTAFVGEISAFICSCAYCISAAAFYRHSRNKKGAIKAMIFASFIMIAVSCISNYSFIIPAYVKMFGMPLEKIIEMGNKIFPVVHDKFSFVLCCVLPFNAIKVLIIDILTLFLYKRISPLLKD